MFKEYNPNFKKPENAKRIGTLISVIKHLESGMEGSTYNGSIVTGGNGTITITVPELKLSVSVRKDEMELLLK